MNELLKKPLPAIPADIQEALCHPNIILTAYENKNEVLINQALQQEVGYKPFPDGSWLVAMICPMPGITKEMIDWWFWWHCQDNLRLTDTGPGCLLAWYGSDESQDYHSSRGHEVCHYAGLRLSQRRPTAPRFEGLQAQAHGADYGPA